MTPSADRRNVIRSLMVYLCAANLGAALVIPPGDERTPDAGTASWVRVSLQDVVAAISGYESGDRMIRQEALVSVECFVSSLATEQTGSTDAVEYIASRAVDALQTRDILIRDYVTDSTGATLASAVLRVSAPPTVLTPAPVEGYQRRTVQARVRWFARHLET